jgi:hypothetical protein
VFFYRIEHKESGIGPYRASIRTKTRKKEQFYNVMRKELGHTFESGYHVAPYQDEKLKDQYRKDETVGDLRYGFASLTKLRRWFGTDEKTYRVFKKYGFVLRRYTTKNRIDGREQSMSHKEDLTKVKELPYDKVTTQKS